jgi:hypothetical protein
LLSKTNSHEREISKLKRDLAASEAKVKEWVLKYE